MLALGSMQAKQGVAPIIKRLHNNDEWEVASESLIRIGEVALPELGEELKNKNWLIRLRAIKTLKKMNSPEIHSMLEPLRNDPNEVVKAEVISILKS